MTRLVVRLAWSVVYVFRFTPYVSRLTFRVSHDTQEIVYALDITQTYSLLPTVHLAVDAAELYLPPDMLELRISGDTKVWSVEG